jgi:hypothetical protein
MNSETKDSIKGFLSSITSKDYKQANSFLQKTIENKLKERVQVSLASKK